jgi:hypothetical protein
MLEVWKIDITKNIIITGFLMCQSSWPTLPTTILSLAFSYLRTLFIATGHIACSACCLLTSVKIIYMKYFWQNKNKNVQLSAVVAASVRLQLMVVVIMIMCKLL